MMSPTFMCGCSAPVLPTLIKCVAPTLANSSTAIAADGQPIPVEVALTLIPL